MADATDQEFLLSEEYSDASDLNTRIHIQERFSARVQEWFHWLYDQLDLSPRSHILELGCGPGTLWQENLSRLPSDWNLVLTDLSWGMVQAARRNLARDGRHFTFSVADAQAIPFKAACFDAIIAYGVFDHVPHRQQTFAEILRVLKSGGRLYASAGGQTHLQQIEALVRPFVSEADYGGDPDRFGLENGLALLSPWFTAVRRLLYQDVLVFRQVEPIVAYVLSEAEVKCALVDDKLARFIAFVQREMARRGEIRVTVDKGIFAARKGSEEDEA